MYPSALHVRWTLPAWAQELTGRKHVSSLAVDVEPQVFWDGKDPEAAEAVNAWAAGRFRVGDAPHEHGYVAPGLNGTSGKQVVLDVFTPLGRTLHDVWLTDAVNRFFV